MTTTGKSKVKASTTAVVPASAQPWDAEWLDRMYNNRALVPDHAMYFARWADASEDAREAHANELNIPYGTSPLETLDVFPAAKKNSPVVVFIHGGYWRSLDKSQHSFLVSAFKNEGGCVVMPNYDLCPAVTISDITMQMVKALAWTYRNIKKFGGDPNRITVVGHSAGGHLATMLLACHWAVYDRKLPADLVKGAMSISGLYDLEPLRHTPFLADSLRLTPDVARMNSPALFARPAQGQLYSVVGGDESAEFLRHNTLMRQAWGKKTVPVCESIKGRNHFSVLEDLSAPWERVNKLAVSLMLSA